MRVKAGTSNGLDHTREENKGQDNGEGEEDLEETEEEEEKGLDDNTRLDSGSDTDEFCDTSDQLIQVCFLLHLCSSVKTIGGHRTGEIFAMELFSHGTGSQILTVDRGTG